MRTKILLLGILLFLSVIAVKGQDTINYDSSRFHNLKLHSEIMRATKPHKRGGNVTSIRKVNTYFFFSKNGIYNADKFGVLIYSFITPVKAAVSREDAFGYRIEAYDTERDENCIIVFYSNDALDERVLTVIYDDYSFAFYCEFIE